MIRRKLLAALVFATWPLFGHAQDAAPCDQVQFENTRFTLCEVGADQDLRLFHSGPDGSLLGSFAAVNRMLGAEGRQLVFAMNAGMYHPDRAPVGLYIDRQGQSRGIVTGGSDDNFGMLPNGVFCIRNEGFAVIESRSYAARPPACLYATQSGPLLVSGGKLHPRFIPDSDSRYIRNGVGVSANGRRAVFVISESAVNFDTFGRFFRDALDLPDALYFDGKVSRLYAPALRRSDIGLPMGPIVGLVGAAP